MDDDKRQPKSAWVAPLEQFREADAREQTLAGGQGIVDDAHFGVFFAVS